MIIPVRCFTCGKVSWLTNSSGDGKQMEQISRPDWQGGRKHCRGARPTGMQAVLLPTHDTYACGFNCQTTSLQHLWEGAGMISLELIKPQIMKSIRNISRAFSSSGVKSRDQLVREIDASQGNSFYEVSRILAGKRDQDVSSFARGIQMVSLSSNRCSFQVRCIKNAWRSISWPSPKTSPASSQRLNRCSHRWQVLKRCLISPRSFQKFRFSEIQISPLHTNKRLNSWCALYPSWFNPKMKMSTSWSPSLEQCPKLSRHRNWLSI